MALTAFALLCCTLISGETPNAPAPPAVTVEKTAASPLEGTPKAATSVPDAPLPKMEIASASTRELDLVPSAEPSAPAIPAAINAPVKPALTGSFETSRKRKIWYGLMVAGHGTAAFDAWTTRRAISSGYGVEGDPLQRPFAHSGAIYATTQVTPVIMDYLGRRMMRSSNPFLRKMWWVPQAASASVSLGAGVHNYSIAP